MYDLDNLALIMSGTLKKGVAVDIVEYSIDSRTIFSPEQTVFFALKGEHHNGHDYIAPLYKSGVRAFVISDFREDYHQLHEGNFILVKEVLTALQTLAAYHRAHAGAEVVGITGSNGKTIVKEWLYQLLAPDFSVYRSPRSYNSQVGVPLSLLGIYENAEIAIIEAGISQKGEMRKLERMIRPDTGIFTHLSNAHEENFSSRKEVLNEKALLFRSCKLIIGRQGDAMEHIRNILPDSQYLLWGENESADVFVYGNRPCTNGRITEIRYEQESFSLNIPFSDEASFENVLHAVAYLLYRGISPHTIRERVERLSAIAMRMEIKEGIHRSVLVNDFYNSDPDSFRLALQTLAQQDPLKARTVILSDFVDTGNDDPILYRNLSSLLQQYGVSLFIGIGEKISRHRDFFGPNTRFYENTEQFLRQEDRDSFREQVILIKGARRFRFEYIAGFLQKQSHGTLLEVDLDALVYNLNWFREKTPARMAVMVKAFSYGAGSREIASILQFHQVDYLMVAYADEGIELRAAGITLPIAVMNPEQEAFDNMITFGLEPEIYSPELLEDFEKALLKHGIKHFPVHIKLNTGMNRSGLDEKDIPGLIGFFDSPRILYIKSLFSHLACSDDPEQDDFTLEQFRRFEEMTRSIQARFHHPIWRHILNSAGIERFPEHHYDMVRLGIGLHGISATGTKLKPVSTMKSFISSVREVAAGQPVGYGRKSYTVHPSRIAMIPVGYADGLNRKLSNRIGEVYVKGERVPIIGNISMDSCMIDITGTDANVGDEVEIFGAHIPVTELAGKLDTIPYEVLTGISQRVKRIYYKE